MSINYARSRAEFPKQKAALTRAITHWRNSDKTDNSRVVKTCRETVKAWNEWGAWPDDWARWQRALSDTLPWYADMDLRDL